MNRYLNILFSDLKRAVLSYQFVFAVIGIVLIKFPGIWTDLKHYQGADVLYFYNYALSEGIFCVYYLLCAFPCSTIFLQDWNNRFFRTEIIRCGKNAYIVSKIITCIIVSISVVFIAELLFVGILLNFCPLIDVNAACQSYNNLSETVTFGSYLKQSFWLYFFSMTSLEALSGAFFAIFAMCISTKITNIFVVLSAPLLCQYYLSMFLGILSLPPWLDISCVSTGQYVFGDTNSSFIYGITFFAITITLISIVFAVNIKRKIHNA